MSTTGGRSASADNGTAIGERVHQDDKSRRFVKKIAASSKRMMSGEPKSPRIPALGLGAGVDFQALSFRSLLRAAVVSYHRVRKVHDPKT